MKTKDYRFFRPLNLRTITAAPLQGVASSKRACFKVFSALAVLFVLLAAPLRAQFAYVANASANSVSAKSIGSSGALTRVPGSPFATGTEPRFMAVDPAAKFVYVPNEFDNTVSAYSIGSNGALTPVSGSPFAAAVGPFAVAVDPTARFAYVANNTSNNVSAYSIDQTTGALTPVAGSPFAAGSGPRLVVVDPTGRFVYEPNSGETTVSAYSIGSNGALTPVPGSPFATGSVPYSVAVDPTGRFLYVANHNGNTVSAHSIGSNGALTPVPGSPFATGSPSSVAVDPTGRFVYVANEFYNTVSAYNIGSNGALTPVPGSPFATAEPEPVSVAVDPTGKFAYAACLLGLNVPGSVSAYSIGSNGALTPVPGSPFHVRRGNSTIAITPLVPFAASSAKLEIESELSSFDLQESFTLGANTNGINPVTQNVTIQIGTYSVKIPPDSFKKKSTGKFVFAGTIKKVSLNLKIVPLGNDMYTFLGTGSGVDLDVTNPVTVVLTIGIDSGTTSVDYTK